MTQVPCPSVAELERLFCEEPPPDIKARLEQHVEHCRSCMQTLNRILLGESNSSAPKSKVLTPENSAATAFFQQTVADPREPKRDERQPPASDAQAVDKTQAPASDFARLELDGVESNGVEFNGIELTEATANDAAPAPRRLGPYLIERIIGRGGMGVVLRGYDPGLQREVAIKVLSPNLGADRDARQRFMREASTAAQVEHQYIVPIFAVGQHAGLPYLAMQYVAGVSLEEHISQFGPLPLDELVRLATQLAEGLAAAHDRGIMHRDVKPSNILLQAETPAAADPSASSQQDLSSASRPQLSSTSRQDLSSAQRQWRQIKITDFGLARNILHHENLTQTGLAMGTPAYMAPEQIEGQSTDHRADLYGLGLVLYAAATGKNPFSGTTGMALLDHQRYVQPAAPSESSPGGIPAWLDRLILSLLRKDRDQRPQSAHEVLDAIRQALAPVESPALVPLTEEQEHARIAALRRYKILDTEPEQGFDDLTFLASHICGTPIALISLVDVDRQWFKSRLGISVMQTARAISFCQHTIQGTTPFIVGDAHGDPRFSSNPLVVSDPNIRFYAGVPLIDDTGYALGSMCVIDRVARQLSSEQLAALSAISRLVVQQLTLRRDLDDLRNGAAGQS